jgi:superfamily II DNA or RNA helicase
MSDVVISAKNYVYIKLKCEPHILYELAPYFTFELDHAKYMKGKNKYWSGDIRLLSVTTGEIFSGLLDRVIAKIKTLGYTYEFEYSKFYGSPFEVNEEITKEGISGFMTALGKKSGIKPYEYQIAAVYECLRYNRKTIVSPTASGKSFCLYAISRYYLTKGLKILCIFPTTTLIHQMFKDWIDYGFDSEDNIHTIYQGQTKKSDKDVTFTTWQSIYKLDKSFYNDYDVIIVDECHNTQAKSLSNIMKNAHNVKYRFGFTGTLSNNGSSKAPNELTITGLFGPSYKTVNTKELIEKGRASQLNIHCLVLKHSQQKFNAYEDEVQYLITNEKRNNYIKNLALSLKGNTLIMFSRVETHGEVLYNLIKEKVNDDRKIFFIHGGVEGTEREAVRAIVEREDNAIIVASYQCYSTGVSIKNLHNTILAFPVKGSIRLLQTIGRGLRISKTKNKSVLYDIADDCGDNYTLKHFTERVKIYLQEDFDYEIFTINIEK